jgi:cysteinyl-tRNA synthetase
LLEADRILWEAQNDLENPEFLTQGRERFREMIVRLGALLGSLPRSRTECLSTVVEALLEARARYRRASRWLEADVVREVLAEAQIVIEDTNAGPRWRLK